LHLKTDKKGIIFMKLQISFDMSDLEKAIAIAVDIEPYVDIFEVGTLLLYQYGVRAIEAFVQRFPEKQILADTKIVDHAKEAIHIVAATQVHWISVMAGTHRDTLQAACTAAHESKIKIMLDLLDSNAPGQSAMEAKTIGVHALLVHRLHEEKDSQSFAEKWEMIRGNTTLPIFVSGAINRQNVHEFISLQPEGLVIGSAVIKAENPVQEAAYFASLIHGD
jgi:3-hexulose-6-phosphate synthase